MPQTKRQMNLVSVANRYRSRLVCENCCRCRNCGPFGKQFCLWKISKRQCEKESERWSIHANVLCILCLLSGKMKHFWCSIVCAFSLFLLGEENFVSCPKTKTETHDVMLTLVGELEILELGDNDIDKYREIIYNKYTGLHENYGKLTGG